MITAGIRGDAAVLSKLRRITPAVQQRLRDETARLSARLLASIREDFLSGQALHVRSGRLQNALSAATAENNDASRVRIFLDLNAAKYGAFWETGFARSAGAGARGGPGALLGRARERYALRHPASVKQYDARPFLHPAFAVMQEEIVSSLIEAGTGAVSEAML